MSDQDTLPTPTTSHADLLEEVLRSGRLPEHLPESLAQDTTYLEMMEELVSLQRFATALSQGDLETSTDGKGKLVGALKSLQANLRHLTWQAQRIAGGNLNQRVDFLGDFAIAFNRMVESLRNSRKELEQRAQELVAERRAALNLMLDAQEAQAEIEKTNQSLQERLAEIQQLQTELRNQAIRDPLTGCYNRRFLEESLTLELSRAMRDHYSVSMMMIDIDHFKNINDTYGHQTGDLALIAVGELLRSGMRSGDIVARYGGEEFIAIMPNTPLDIAHQRSEQLRIACQQFSLNDHQPPIKLTISVGLASFPVHGQSWIEVLQKADHALYAAKAAGRNRVMQFPLADGKFET
ncbi:MAG: diguanylate cyclase [Anaerolineae bacterium]|nr:diguanylate cyclase [Anaerolineae bacterium]